MEMEGPFYLLKSLFHFPGTTKVWLTLRGGGLEFSNFMMKLLDLQLLWFENSILTLPQQLESLATFCKLISTPTCTSKSTPKSYYL